MKRNVIVILTLALVCVLFVACGKEEITQQQYNAAMSKLEEAEAALNAAKAELQNLNQNSDAVTTPVEKTREEMTEAEKQIYDLAKIEELNAVELCDRFDVFYDEVESGELVSAYYDTSDDLVVYCPEMEYLSEAERQLAASPRFMGTTIALCAGMGEDYDLHKRLGDYLSKHPDELIIMTKLYLSDSESFRQDGMKLIEKVSN